MSDTVEDRTVVRQRDLARWIGEHFHKTDKLTPLDRHGSFSLYPLGFGLWTDMKVSELAWWAVGYRLQAAADKLSWHGVIDHAWLAGFDGQESWAFVTEPYLDPDLVPPLIRSARRAMSRWELMIEALSPDRSSWNPGNHCVPIVVTFKPDWHAYFMRKALSWIIENEHLSTG